jgi:hypothetical protein
VRRDVRIPVLRVDGPVGRRDELAASIERSLARLLAGDRLPARGPGADVARAVHAELRRGGDR